MTKSNLSFFEGCECRFKNNQYKGNTFIFKGVFRN